MSLHTACQSHTYPTIKVCLEIAGKRLQISSLSKRGVWRQDGEVKENEQKADPAGKERSDRIPSTTIQGGSGFLNAARKTHDNTHMNNVCTSSNKRIDSSPSVKSPTRLCITSDDPVYTERCPE